MLVASMNPSPSGFFKDPNNPMSNTAQEMQRYLGRISGPLLDRIDIHIEVTPVPFEKLAEERKGELSKTIRARVCKARAIQTERFSKIENVHYNAQMSVKQLRKFCRLGVGVEKLVKSGNGAPKPVRKGLRPHLKSESDHRRPRSRTLYFTRPHRRSHPIPKSRSRRLAGLKDKDCRSNCQNK
jgi:hypothetical protein